MDRLSLKDTWRDVRPGCLAMPIFLIVRLLGITWRYRIEGLERSEGIRARIVCGWHGRSLPYAYRFRGQGVLVIISLSRDGEMQANVFGRLGYRIIRGSTRRGGIRAAIEAVRALREGGTMALTPDGPRGPSGVVQGGAMLMAQRSGAALVPVGISARPRRLFGSWDRYMVPAPFAHIRMVFGDPIFVPAEASEEEVERLRLQLESEIHRLEGEVESALSVA